MPLFPQVRCDGVPDDLIMGCLELWLVVNFVWFCMSLQSSNMIPVNFWFSIGMSNMDVISTYFIIFLHISTYFHSCSIHFPSIHFCGPIPAGGSSIAGGVLCFFRHRTPIATSFGPLERAGSAVAPVASSFAKHTLEAHVLDSWSLPSAIALIIT